MSEQAVSLRIHAIGFGRSSMQQELFASENTITAECKNETNFVDNMKLPIHRWFRFSAGYSARWVETLLRSHDSLTGTRPIVLDPFAGSGTTLLASSRHGSTAYGWESQPFIYRIARAKVGSATVDPFELHNASEEILMIARQSTCEPTMNEHPLLQKCFYRDVLRDLRKLQHAIVSKTSAYDPKVNDLLWLVLAAILRPASHVGTAQWQYIQPNKTKSKTVEPFQGFAGLARRICEDILTEQRHLSAEMHLDFHDARIASTLDPGSVDIVVTSPPYANNFDYADATRLEMTFFGHVKKWSDLRSVRDSLVHACSQHMAGYDSDAVIADPLLDPIRPPLERIYEDLARIRLTRGGKKAYHAMIVGYFYDMAQVWMNLRQVVRDGGIAHFVIGDSAPYGVYVPVDTFLGDLAVSVGFSEYEFVELRRRNIKWKNRKHRVPLKEGILEVRA